MYSSLGRVSIFRSSPWSSSLLWPLPIGSMRSPLQLQWYRCIYVNGTRWSSQELTEQWRSSIPSAAGTDVWEKLMCWGWLKENANEMAIAVSAEDGGKGIRISIYFYCTISHPCTDFNATLVLSMDIVNPPDTPSIPFDPFHKPLAEPIAEEDHPCSMNKQDRLRYVRS